MALACQMDECPRALLGPASIWFNCRFDPVATLNYCISIQGGKKQIKQAT